MTRGSVCYDMMHDNAPAADALIAKGQWLLGQGRALDAMECIHRALVLVPAHVPALVCRGLALKDMRRLDEARSAFEAAIAIQPDCVSAHVNRAGILRQLGLSRDALESSDRAIELQPDFAPAHCNRGLALADLDRPLEALESYDRALAIDPEFAAAYGNRGKALDALNRPQEALAAYERVTELQPDAAQAYVNAGHTHLLLGQFGRGWPLYEWRKKLPTPLGNRSFAIPLWLGSPDLAGKKLLLHWEQGLGDTIQFCRYARLAKARGAQVVLVVQSGLSPLVRTLGPDVEVRTEEDMPADCDTHCPLLSAPHAFGTDLQSIPADVPYLFADPERVSRWREWIGSAGFKIGIAWQGNAQSPADRGRSFPLQLFHRIATIPGVRLIALQVGAGTEQLENLPRGMSVESLGRDFDRGPDAFLDSAAVMQSLDLVITSDSAVAHLAGALACPTWVALQQVPDWRWLRERGDCPWYPGMRLFRQKLKGRWDDVFETIRGELFARLNGSSNQ